MNSPDIGTREFQVRRPLRDPLRSLRGQPTRNESARILAQGQSRMMRRSRQRCTEGDSGGAGAGVLSPAETGVATARNEQTPITKATSLFVMQRHLPLPAAW